MRFKQFLNESMDQPFTTEMSVEEAFEWIKGHAPQYASGLNIHKALFRGMDVSNPNHAQFGDTSTFERSSANTRNFYTLLIDSSKKWNDYPKRSKSFICSTYNESARSYGSVFVAFPDDNANLGICPETDIWHSFNLEQKLELRSLNHLNIVIELLVRSMTNQSPSEVSAKKLREELRGMTTEKVEGALDTQFFVPGDVYRGSVISIAAYMKKHEIKNLDELLEILLDPTENGFSVIKTKNFHNSKINHHEIWFSGGAVFIPLSWFLNKGNRFNKLFTANFGNFAD